MTESQFVEEGGDLTANKVVIFFKGGKGGGACSFYIKNKLKSEIFNDKKIFLAKMFFSVITKSLKWEVLTKNLVTFKRWDWVKDEKF